MAPKRALMGCNITLFGRNPSWDHATQSKAGNWLAHLSGRLVSFGDNTTHLIVSKKRWTEDPKPAILQKALANPNIKILTFDWMEDCLNSQSRKREQPYEWAEIEAAAAKVKAKSKKQLEKEEKKKAANSVPGMMSEVFHESTQPFVDPVEARKLEKQLEREREEQKKREQEAKEEKIKRKKEQAMIFGRGAMRARNVALSDTYHIFADSTGFKLDIRVTKVDTRANRNEVWTLSIQIFESNAEPYNYATNTQFKGTGIAPASNVVSALGTTYPTAMHAFKTEFYDRTGIEWDERISAHIKSLRQKRIDRGEGTESPALSSVKGVAVSESAAKEIPFEKRKFKYHPPGYGPKGEVSNEERKRCKALGVTLVDGSKDGKNAGKKVPAVTFNAADVEKDTLTAVEEWIKGADMSTIAPPPPAAGGDGVLVGVGQGEEMDFGAMLAAGAGQDMEAEMAGLGAEYPFEQALDEAVDAEHGAGAAKAIENGTFDIMAAGVDDSAIALPATDGDRTFDGLGDFSGRGWDDSWMLFGSGSGNGIVERNEEGPGNLQIQQETQHDSLQPGIPSFTTHANTSGAETTSFQHGMQEIGETQVVEKVRGEFLEDLQAVAQQPTPPASKRKNRGDGGDGDAGSDGSAGSRSVLGGLNLGDSILGKRKIAPAAETDEGQGERSKKFKTVMGEGLEA